VALAAAHTAAAAEYACCDIRKRDAEFAARAAEAAAEADPSSEARARIVDAWQKLLAAAEAEGWKKHTPVPDHFLQPPG
jgi:hypothetical protein